MEEESNQWSEFRTFEVEASADARGKSSSPEDLHLPGAERGKVGEASARERGRRNINGEAKRVPGKRRLSHDRIFSLVLS